LLLTLAAYAGNEPPSSFLELRPLEPRARQLYVPVRELCWGVELVGALCERHDFVGLGIAPRVMRSGKAEAVERFWCLLADVDSPEALDRLRAFRPRPSIVARSLTPGHCHAYWSLREPLSPKQARRANLRLAREFGSDQAIVDAARVMRAPREFAYLEPLSFTLGEVVRNLSDDPRYAPHARSRDRHDNRRARPVRNGARRLDGLARFVREAQEGERNNRLNWAAYAAGKDAVAGQLDGDQAHDELLLAATDVGLAEHEALATIRSGLHAGGLR
jgi:hypothetical protein